MMDRYGINSDTVALEMILPIPEFLPQYTALCQHLHKEDRLCIKAVKKKMGRQDHCWVGGSQNRRFFIWRVEELWVLVHNEKGLVLEVPRQTTVHRAWELWNLLCSKMGFDPLIESPQVNLPIKVTPGTITVEGISGRVREDHFILYVDLREKHAEAECVCENPALVSIRATSKTLRTVLDEYEKIDLLKERSTVIELPSGWAVEASVSRYTCCILGIKKPESLTRDLPYTVIESRLPEKE